MNNVKIFALAALMGSTALTAQAGGLERTGQPVGALFETGTYAEISFGMVRPSIEGTDVAGLEITDSADNYNVLGLAYKQQLTPALSMALIYDQPFGAKIDYQGANIFTNGVDGSNTTVEATSQSLSAILRYQTPSNFSIYGGLVAQEVEGEINLRGDGYGPVGAPGSVNGYSVDMDGDWGYGYLIGTSWEKPEIAARVALTYRSSIDHELDSTESIYGSEAPLAAFGLSNPSKTEFSSPQSVTLDFQTGVAPKTLLFGSIRWVDWSDFAIAPALIKTGGEVRGVPDAALVSYEDDQWTYTLGLGRQITENFAASISITHETSTDELVSTLGPTDGFTSIGLGGKWTMNNIDLSLGARYIMPGDADTGVAGNKVATFEDNSAWAVGGKIGMHF